MLSIKFHNQRTACIRIPFVSFGFALHLTEIILTDLPILSSPLKSNWLNYPRATLDTVRLFLPHNGTLLEPSVVIGQLCQLSLVLSIP